MLLKKKIASLGQLENTHKKDMFLVLDTETLGYSAKNPSLMQKVFDIGYKIVDRNNVEYSKGSFIVEEFYRETIEKHAFYKEKILYYDKYVKSGYSKVMPYRDIIDFIEHEAYTYDVDFLVAYNLGFDDNVVKKTMGYFHGQLDQLPFDFLVKFDLYHVASQTILNTPKYMKWAIENSHLNYKTMNIKTGAESCFAYLIGEPDFIEQHTALSDVEIECDILYMALKTSKEYDISINGQSWKIPNSDKRKVLYYFDRYHPEKRDISNEYRLKEKAKKDAKKLKEKEAKKKAKKKKTVK